MANPVAAHTFDFVRIYLSTRTGGAPGSGVWTSPLTIFDGTLNPSFVDAITFSAGALGGADPSGILCQTDNAGKLAFLGNGAPATPVQISVGADQFLSSDYWDISQGAWTINGNLYAIVTKSPSNINPTSIIKSTDGGITWAYMDAAHQPPRSDTVAVQRVDGKIYWFGAVSSPSFGAAFYIFDTATDTWSAQTGFLANFPLQNMGQNAWSNGIFPFANGDIGVIYTHDSSGPGAGVVYHLYAGGAWGTPVYIPGANYGVSLLDPSQSLIHVFNYVTNRAGQVIYSTVTHAGVATPSIFTFPATPAGSDGLGHPSIQNGMIFVPRDDSADFDNSVWVATLPATTFFKETLPIPVGESGVIAAAWPGGTGTGYVVGDTGTINGGAPGFLARYRVLFVYTNAISTYSWSTPNLGTGYVVGDIGTVNGGTTAASYQVLAVGAGGSVTNLVLTQLGAGYTTGLKATTPTSGVGSGLQISVDSVFSGVAGITLDSNGGGYSVANGVGTTNGGAQPGVGTGLTINITAVKGKTPSCAYMMFPNGYSLVGTISIACPISPLTATVGVLFVSAPPVVTGDTPPDHFELLSGPPWMTIDPLTGIVSGIPNSTGSFTYTIKVTDSLGHVATVAAPCPLTVGNAPPPPMCIPAPVPVGQSTAVAYTEPTELEGS